MGGPPPGTWPIAAFAAEYKVMRRRDMTHAEIGEALGLQRKSVERNVGRARKAGLLPPYNPRETHELLARRHLVRSKGDGKQ
jgi:hypothetical protein